MQPLGSSMPIPGSPRRRLLAEGAVVFGVGLVAYAASISPNLSAAHDSVTYLNAIDEQRGLFHPHHLLYNATAIAWVAAWRALGVSWPSAFLVPLMSAVAGALALALFHRVLRERLRLDARAAAAATALPACSFGMWFYSACVEVYVVPLVFLLLALHRLSAERLRERDLAWTGLAVGAATLFHQVHALFAVVVVVAVLRRRRSLPAVRALARFAAVFVPAVAVPYLAVMLLAQGIRDPADAWDWVTGYAHNPSFWAPLVPSTAVKAVIGFGRAVVGGHFAFAVPSIQALAESALGGHFLMDEQFLVRALAPGAALGLVVATALLVALVVTAAAVRLPRARRVLGAHSLLLPLVIAWLASYGLFFSFWEPHNAEFWIPQVMCAWLLFAALVAARPLPGRRARAVLPAVAGLLFTVNLLGSIRWLASPENDYYRVQVAPLAGLVGRDDLVVAGRSWMYSDYVRRLTGASVVALDELYARAGSAKEYVGRVRSAVDGALAAGARVVVLGNAVAIERESVARFGRGLGAVDELWRELGPRWRRVGAGTSEAFLLEPHGWTTVTVNAPAWLLTTWLRSGVPM